MCGTQLTSRIYKRVGPRRLMIAGMSGTVLTIGAMALAGRSDACMVFQEPVNVYWHLHRAAIALLAVE